MSKPNESPDPFRGNPPASDLEIAAFETEAGIRLPDDYLWFLRRMNGGCGFVGSNYVDLWAVDKLIEYNRGYGVDKYAPELLLFGSNGGGEALAFDRSHVGWPIIRLPFVPLDIREAITLASTFGVLFERLARDSASGPE